MSVTDYVIDILLIAVIFRQVRTHPLTPRAALLPLMLLAIAGAIYHSGGPSIAKFSVSHDITGASIWTTAFFLMAFGQVIARAGMLQLRRIRSASAVPAHEPATMAP